MAEALLFDRLNLVRACPPGPAGFEHTPLKAPKTGISEKARTRDSTPVARGDARDPDLAELIDRWPDLPETVRERIMAMVRG